MGNSGARFGGAFFLSIRRQTRHRRGVRGILLSILVAGMTVTALVASAATASAEHF